MTKVVSKAALTRRINELEAQLKDKGLELFAATQNHETEIKRKDDQLERAGREVSQLKAKLKVSDDDRRMLQSDNVRLRARLELLDEMGLIPRPEQQSIAIAEACQTVAERVREFNERYNRREF